MHFVFDIDETLVKGDIIAAVSNEMFKAGQIDRRYSGKDVNDFDLGGLPDNLSTRVREAFCLPRFVKMKKAIPEAYHFLCALYLNKHKISALTARPNTLINETLCTLVQNFPKITFSNIEFCNNSSKVELGSHRPNKLKKLKELKPDFYFDDSIEHCNTAAEIGIETYIISNSHTGWNHNKTKLHNSVKVLKHVGKFDCRRL